MSPDQNNNPATDNFFNKLINDASKLTGSFTNAATGTSNKELSPLNEEQQGIRNSLIAENTILMHGILNELLKSDFKNTPVSFQESVSQVILNMTKTIGSYY